MGDLRDILQVAALTVGKLEERVAVLESLVAQVIGDSVLALWTAPVPDTKLKAAACRAALEISEAVDLTRDLPVVRP